MENIIKIKHPTPVYSVNLWKERWEKSLVISDKNWLLFSLYVSYQILIDIERETKFRKK